MMKSIKTVVLSMWVLMMALWLWPVEARAENVAVSGNDAGIEEEVSGEGNYRILYIYTSPSRREWTKQFYDMTTGQKVSEEKCSLADIPDGACITVHETPSDEPLVFDVDLTELYIAAGLTRMGDEVNVVVNGNVADMNVGIAVDNVSCNVKVHGDVEKLMLREEKPGSNYNVYVSGTVANGIAKQAASGSKTIGYFNCTNQNIIYEGEWNSNLFFAFTQEEASTEYAPLRDQVIGEALEGYGLGQEAVVEQANGSVTLVKTAEVQMNETAEEKFAQLKDTEELKGWQEKIQNIIVVDGMKTVTAPIAAVDANIVTEYRNQVSWALYEEGEYARETIAQLNNGKTIKYRIQIPTEVYGQADAYAVLETVVHEDGTISMEHLETSFNRNGGVIEFSSDKSGTFIVMMTTLHEQEDWEWTKISL